MKSLGKLLALTLLFLFAAGVIGALAMQLMNQNSVDGLAATSQFFEHNKLLFTAFRVSLLSLLFWQWERFISWLAKIHHWDDDMRFSIIEARWRILSWFVIFEMIVNQNLLGYLFN